MMDSVWKRLTFLQNVIFQHERFWLNAQPEAVFGNASLRNQISHSAFPRGAQQTVYECLKLTEAPLCASKAWQKLNYGLLHVFYRTRLISTSVKSIICSNVVNNNLNLLIDHASQSVIGGSGVSVLQVKTNLFASYLTRSIIAGTL
ncbi:hypothetical protein T4D_6913 [Trichinella pseudospiralis]|uniref:Uncharacterized protein n=1 Tax=Trichinella pseudospiralis TaxID=6337 RepID=A0A0V1FXD0_TRIPS|nr:hypothetical protein T4D_6913 [Trichinella pseudospiralis]